MANVQLKFGDEVLAELTPTVLDSTEKGMCKIIAIRNGNYVAEGIGFEIEFSADVKLEIGQYIHYTLGAFVVQAAPR